MADEITELEEDEYTSELTGPTFRRIAGLVKPHWKAVISIYFHLPGRCPG
jgi:hypothetical protein